MKEDIIFSDGDCKIIYEDGQYYLNFGDKRYYPFNTEYMLDNNMDMEEAQIVLDHMLKIKSERRKKIIDEL